MSINTAKSQSPAAVASPTKPSLKSTSSPSLLIALLVIAAALGWSKVAQHELQVNTMEELIVRVSDQFNAQFNTRVEHVDSASDEHKEPELLDKYDDKKLIAIEVRQLVSDLSCSDENYVAEPLLDGNLVPVQEPMQQKQPMGDDKVFFMLNGRNEGVYVSWNGDFNCIGKASELAAVWLGADRDVMENGVRLYNQMGHAIRNAEELTEAKNIVHILLDFQLWQWPGIEKGYQYHLEDGVVLTTVGMQPKVFDVQYFLTQNESEKIMEIGIPHLERSKVDGVNSSLVTSDVRTSHTAFLSDDEFTRLFRVRAARVARLPSPSFAERLQLVRYDAGQFYRQHYDTFDSKKFVREGANTFYYEDYEKWAEWAAEKLRGMDQSKLPEEYREGGTLFPNAQDEQVFPNTLLELFYDHMTSMNMFDAMYEEPYQEWFRDNLDKNVTGLMKSLMAKDGRPLFLPRIVQVWEEKLGRGELRYTFPKRQVEGLSHYYNWIRWAKERVSYLGDDCPSIARLNGELYPKYTVSFQNHLLDFIFEDYSDAFITRMTNAEWFKWINENYGNNFVLFEVLKAFPEFIELVIRSWESRVQSSLLRYKLPKYVKHFHPQRYVTLFLYLNNQTKIGGETVFPLSRDRFSEEGVVRKGMDECSQGLAVPPRGLHASLFYTQTPEGDVDHLSRHGGCPPHEGTKWGSNSFMWDSDSEEGADLWSTK